MDITRKLAVSFYKTIATINEDHNIYLVQHQETQKVYIKKVLDVYNRSIYEYLYSNPIIGTPNIIDFYEENDQLTIIEEYVSGCSLQEIIQTGLLTINKINSYMIDLCNILVKLHTSTPAIIHRDIKPSNVIITNYDRAVLLDFNAAKHFSSSSAEDTVLLGTQGYAAPEQYGFGSSSPQTDIYSLGILLKEMLTSSNIVDRKYNAIVKKCTQINPKERFKNISELKSALCSLSKSESKDDTVSIPTSFLPPGFRTGNPLKMIIAILGYTFIFWLCLTLQVKNLSTGALWLERIFLLFIMLFSVLGTFNYGDIHKFLPLCKHKYRIVRFLGIILLDALIVFSLIILLLIIQTILFPA